jgi:hypothetical protein
VPKKPKQEKPLLPAKTHEYRNLQSYDDYVNLIQDTINGVMDETIPTKIAHTVGVLTGYGLQALREARGGKMRMSVFMQDMRKVKVEMLSQEEMDLFLQGSEEVQMEVLKQLEDRGGIVEGEVTIKEEPKPKLDTKVLATMTGLSTKQVKDVLSGQTVAEEIKMQPDDNHQWEQALNGGTRFCLNCGVERHTLQLKDMTSACSGQWGLF